MNIRQSSEVVRSIQILYCKENKSVICKTQLDSELTIRLLEMCIKKLKDKTSLKKAVPIGKESIKND